jgi:polysaccharide export outer membrane protein
MRHARILTALLVALAVAGCVHRDGYVETAVVVPVGPDPLPLTPGAALPPAYAPPPVAAVVPVAAELVADVPYTLDSGDKLRVVVFGQDGLSNSYSVDASGNIAMPLIGSVAARGLTTSRLASAIAARLRQGYLREPHVAVEVEAYRPFFILGEVTFPGQYPFVANMTIETAVAIAGGFTPRAKRDVVKLTRPADGGVLRGPALTSTPVRPGDTIVVGERWF